MIWKVIEEFTDYMVSDTGLVKRKQTGRILKPRNDRDGYHHHGLYYKKKNYTKKLHRLVASAFLINSNNLPQVNHIDGNKHNNHVSNLEWCNNSHNQKHSRKMGLLITKQGSECSYALYTEEEVKEMRLMRESGVSQREIAKRFDAKFQTVNLIVNRKTYKNVI